MGVIRPFLRLRLYGWKMRNDDRCRQNRFTRSQNLIGADIFCRGLVLVLVRRCVAIGNKDGFFAHAAADDQFYKTATRFGHETGGDNGLERERSQHHHQNEGERHHEGE